MKPTDRQLVLRCLDVLDASAIHALDRTLLESFVLDVLAEQEGSYPALNEDWLLKCFRALAGRPDPLDEVVLDWVTRLPSATRLEAAGVALQGLWRDGHASAQPVERLLHLRQAIASTDGSEVAVAFALAGALEATLEQGLRERVRGILHEALTRPNAHPFFARVLQRVLEHR